MAGVDVAANEELLEEFADLLKPPDEPDASEDKHTKLESAHRAAAAAGLFLGCEVVPTYPSATEAQAEKHHDQSGDFYVEQLMIDDVINGRTAARLLFFSEFETYPSRLPVVEASVVEMLAVIAAKTDAGALSELDQTPASNGEQNNVRTKIWCHGVGTANGKGIIVLGKCMADLDARITDPADNKQYRPTHHELWVVNAGADFTELREQFPERTVNLLISYAAKARVAELLP